MKKIIFFLTAMLLFVGAAFSQKPSRANCEPPTNFTVEYDLSNCSAAHLNWEAPVGKGSTAPIIAPIIEGVGSGRNEMQMTGNNVFAHKLQHPDGTVVNPFAPKSSTGIYADAYAGDGYEGIYYTLDLATGNKIPIAEMVYEPWPTGEDFNGANIYRIHSNGMVQIVTDAGTVLNYGTIPGCVFAVGLAYNWVSNNGLWYFYDVSGNEAPYSITLYSLNMATLTKTAIGTVTSNALLLGLTMDNAGTLYAIATQTASLVKINTSNAQITTVGPLGISLPNYGQDIAFDRQTGTLYAAPYTAGSCLFGTINTTTGVFASKANYGFTQIATLCVTKTNNLSQANAPSNLAAVPVGTTMACDISWTNPTHTQAGTSLTSITKMVLLRNGVPIQEFSNATVGGAMTFTDNVPSANEYYYTVFAVTSEGNGKSANALTPVGNTCTIRLLMDGMATDSWENAFISITVNGTSFGTYSANGYKTLEKIIVLPTGEVKFSYSSGTYSDEEASFKIFNYDDVMIYEAPRGSLGGLHGQFFTYNNDCSGIIRYNIYRDDNKIVQNFIGNSYTDDDFFNTGHTWAITVSCDMGGESDPVSQTMLACGQLPVGDCNPATNLTVEYDTENCMTAYLNWEDPTGKGATSKDLCLITVEFWSTGFNSWFTLPGQCGVEIFVDGISYGILETERFSDPSGGYQLQTREAWIPGGAVEVLWIDGGNEVPRPNQRWVKIYDADGNYLGGCDTPGCIDNWPTGHLVTSFASPCAAVSKFNYHVYRNDVFLASVNFNSYEDNTYNSSIGYTWSVKVVCEDGSGSEPVSVTMPACGSTCDGNPAANLQVNYATNCSFAQLTWDAPESGKSFTEPLGTFTIPSMDGKGPNTVAYGIRMLSGNTNVPITIPMNSPGSGNALGGNTPLPSGGDWINGEWLFANTEDNNIYKVNLTNGAHTVAVTHAVPGQIRGMAYHIVENVAYLSTLNNFWKVNVTTGATEHAFSTSTDIECFTITNEGRFIGMQSELLPRTTEIVEINPVSGAVSILASVPFFAWFLQDMAIDRETNTVYWAAFETDAASWGEARLYKFDVETRQLTNLGVILNGDGIVAFAIPAVIDNLAQAPTNLTLTPNGIALNGTLSWKNPTHTTDGTPLTNITKMVVELNDVYYTELTSVSPGENMEINITVPSVGAHKFSVYAITSVGNGLGASTTAEFGAMCNVTLVLKAQYTDSWGSANVKITVDGVDYGSYNGNGYTNLVKTVSIPVGNVVFIHTPGYYSNECGLEIYDYDGELLYSVQRMNGLDGPIFDYFNDCGVAYYYNIYRDDTYIATVKGENSYKDETYNPETSHTWSVKVLCKSGGESEPVSVSKGACNFTYTLTPEYGATNVALNAEVAVTFSQNITANDLSEITINGITATASVSANKLIIAHPDFNYETQYTVYIPANAITDYEQEIMWSFTTEDTPVYTIVASVNGVGGTISPSGNISVIWGNNQSFTFTPTTGYHIADVLVDNVSNALAITAGAYSFTNVTANHTITVSFAINTYIITASTGANGTITPNGNVSVNHGASQLFTIAPNTGYHIASIMVDNANIDYTVNAEETEDYDYTFEDVTTTHTIYATFALNCYVPVIVIEAGTVTVSPLTCIPHGSSVTFTITPADCYDVTQVLINGSPSIDYTIANVTDKPTVEVSTQLRQYQISASPQEGIDEMGYIDPSGINTVNCGSSKTFHFVSETGYRVRALYVDDVSVPVPTSLSYTFNNIQANHTINVDFEEFPQYIIQFAPSAAQELGGSVFPTNIPYAVQFIAVDSGTVAFPFSIVPATGYVIDQVFVDNVPNAQAALLGSYIFTNLNADHTIYATFKPTMITITASAGVNGSILPNGTVQVEYGTNITFQAVPNTGCHITNLFVDDESLGATNTYTFSNVIANHTISAFFAKNLYTITTIAQGPGYITPENPEVEHGANQMLTFYPQIGYKVHQVFIDGIPNPAAVEAGCYTFQNVIEPHTVIVEFTIRMLTITETHTSGGQVIPAGITSVEYGAHSEIYVFDAWDGYHLQSVLIDGVNNALAVENMMYRFMDVTENHTIHVVFASNHHIIVATATEGGNINPEGIVTVVKGTDKLFFMAPKAGYDLVRVIVDGINDPTAVATGLYLFTEVSCNHTIAAQFEKKMYDVIYQPVQGAWVTPVGGYSSPVEYNGTYKFTVELEEGYSMSEYVVRANDILLNPTDDVYVINNIFIDQIITIDGIILNKYEIISQAFNGGTITPAGIFMVTHGENKSFTITPNTGFKISDVVVNGESMGDVTSYTFSDIKNNSSIKAFFAFSQSIDQNDEASITVFSNHNNVTIINKQLIPIQQVDIIDMYGRIVWSGQALAEKTEITLDISSGIYAVRIAKADNQYQTTKIVVH